MFKRLKDVFKRQSITVIDEVEETKEVKGDGKAEFFGEPTSEEWLAFEREELGTNAWYDRLKKLL